MDTGFIDFKTIVSIMPGHVYWLDRDGVYKGCNEKQALSNGFKSVNEIVGKRNKDLEIYKNDQDIVEYLDNINTQVMNSGNPVTVEEPAIYGGERGVYLSHKVPIFDKEKNVIGLLGLSFDITQRKKEFLELKKKQENIELTLENIIANLPGHVYWVDKNNCFLGCNDQQAKAFNLDTADKIIGLSVREFQTTENADNIINNNLKVIEKGETIVEEEDFVDINGDHRTFFSKKIPLLNKNKEIIGLLGISVDITEKKEAEEKLKNVVRSRAQFLSLVSHEIKNPLNTIEHCANEISKLVEIKNFDGINYFINFILKQKERSLNFLNNSVSLLTIDESNFTSNYELMLIRDTVIKTIKRIPVIANQMVNIDFDSSIDEFISIDAMNMIWILEIIVKNAIKYSSPDYKKEGTGIIDVKVRNEVEKQNYIIFEITDNGIGMPEKQVERLFEPLVKEANAHAVNPNVALLLVKKKIELLGGEIGVESQYKVGTKIEFKIPYKKLNYVEKINVESKTNKKEKLDIDSDISSKQEFFISKNILLVEDDLVTAKLEKDMLIKLGHNVTLATTGIEAIELALANDYDLIFMDIMLPDMSGNEATEIILKQKKVDIIAITSRTNPKDIEEYRKLKMEECLEKPVSLEIFANFFKAYDQKLLDD